MTDFLQSLTQTLGPESVITDTVERHFYAHDVLRAGEIPISRAVLWSAATARIVMTLARFAR